MPYKRSFPVSAKCPPFLNAAQLAERANQREEQERNQRLEWITHIERSKRIAMAWALALLLTSAFVFCSTVAFLLLMLKRHVN